MFSLIKRMEDMSDGQIRKEVSKGIASGTIGKRQLNYIIRYLERNRPGIFNSETSGFHMIDDRKLWDKAYQNRIHNLIVCGCFCEEILLHMEEVSGKLLLKYRIGTCGVVVGIMGIIFFLIFHLTTKIWG